MKKTDQEHWKILQEIINLNGVSPNWLHTNYNDRYFCVFSLKFRNNENRNINKDDDDDDKER